jgi:hypothetical protein
LDVTSLAPSVVAEGRRGDALSALTTNETAPDPTRAG